MAYDTLATELRKWLVECFIEYTVRSISGAVIQSPTKRQKVESGLHLDPQLLAKICATDTLLPSIDDSIVSSLKPEFQ